MSDNSRERFVDRVALITGGSRGIGAGIAAAFATESAKIAFTYHSREDRAREVVAEIEIAFLGHGWIRGISHLFAYLRGIIVGQLTTATRCCLGG